MRVRDITGEDLATTYAIYRDAARATQPRYTAAQGRAWAPSDDMEDWWPGRIRAGRGWIVDDDGREVGFILLVGDHLDFFYVRSEARGTGVADLLYSTLEQAARDDGIPRLTSFASLFARPFLERRGWQATETQHVERNDETLVRYAMTRELAEGTAPRVSDVTDD